MGAKKPTVRKEHGDARAVVHLVRELTEAQFDFWITGLNRAVTAMGGGKDEFTPDDRQKTVSYWYLLMFLLEVYATADDPFAVRRNDTSISRGLISMRALSHELRERYKEETVRRYVSDLKRCRLVFQDGRGPDAMVTLSAPVIVALTDTMQHWMKAFRDLDRRFERLRTIG
jgi:hypothetical protein